VAETVDKIWEAIVQGLKECIIDHGPITKEFIGSATKRIARAIVESVEHEDELSGRIWDTLHTVKDQERWRMTKEIERLRKDKKVLKKELKKVKRELSVNQTPIPYELENLRKQVIDNFNIRSELEETIDMLKLQVSDLKSQANEHQGESELNSVE
jgi:hypothetical protein